MHYRDNRLLERELNCINRLTQVEEKETEKRGCMMLTKHSTYLPVSG